MIPRDKEFSLIAKTIKKNKTFFIAGHLNPDGDTIGTALALSSLLTRLGKKPRVYSKDVVPEYLSFLQGAGKIIVADKVKGRFDCAIILECLDMNRMGDLISPGQAKEVINIDHHANFNHFGHVNYIDSSASSSSEIIFHLFRHLKMKLTPQEANALYVGVVTDTGKFQYNNTTSSAVYMASCLIDAGVKPYYIYNKLYSTKTFSSLKLFGLALSGLKKTDSGKIAYIEITKEMYKKSGSNVTESEGIVNETLKIPGVVIGALFREEKERNITKISLRSHEKYNVNKVVQVFGGGGHKNASGCTYKGTMETAKKVILSHLEKLV
ncbi:MAG: bifunctional oligoribonuclease/PAP phosphatase NrnA [Elusimicrobia bacterium]|nr:bifunctional oligoribonuclease/PAP phosphatase NrnA [Candidatus Liberimonas magnetica]